MPGLPRKYAKMGFAKGWRAYKASKNKRRSPKRKSSKRKSPKRRRRNPAPRARKRRSNPGRSRSRRLIPRLRRPTARSVQRTAMYVGAGVGGAVATAAAVRAMPLTEPTRAWTQLGVGTLGVAMLNPKRALWRFAAGGAALAGALAIVKTQFPNMPLLAGACDGCMGINYQPGNYRRMSKGVAKTLATGVGRSPAERRRLYLQSRRGLPTPAAAIMGVNKQFTGAGGPPVVMGNATGRFLLPGDDL